MIRVAYNVVGPYSTPQEKGMWLFYGHRNIDKPEPLMSLFEYAQFDVEKDKLVYRFVGEEQSQKRDLLFFMDTYRGMWYRVQKPDRSMYRLGAEDLNLLDTVMELLRNRLTEDDANQAIVDKADTLVDRLWKIEQTIKGSKS